MRRALALEETRFGVGEVGNQGYGRREKRAGVKMGKAGGGVEVVAADRDGVVEEESMLAGEECMLNVCGSLLQCHRVRA